MIKINYQSYGTKGFHLRLRFYKDGETKFINVNWLLKGTILKKHWNQNKQVFTPSCPFCDENNEIINQFKRKYEEAAIAWTGSLYGFLASIEKQSISANPNPTISEFIQIIVDKLALNKHADGTLKGSFEDYHKCEKRLREYFDYINVDYFKIIISELTPDIINRILEWVEIERDGKGMRYISKTLHSIIIKADKAGYLSANDFAKCNWYTKQFVSKEKYHTLTEAQIKRFISINLEDICKSSKNELYRDFCLFLLYTGQSPCDALTLRYSDIQKVGGVSYFIFKRRKIAEKQSVPCVVPISDDMERIMLKWKSISKDGYIFPVRSKMKIKEQRTNNGDIKHFLCNLNMWLKKIGNALECKFPLHSYTFRHTAITRYISKGVPALYVSNMMGTSVENIEKIYYNNQGDMSSRNKVLAAMKF